MGDTVMYYTGCGWCEEGTPDNHDVPHDCRFSAPDEKVVDECPSDPGVQRAVYGYENFRWIADTTTSESLSASCPGHGSNSRSIKVVKTATLKIDGQDFIDDTHYIKSENEDLLLATTVTPSAESSEFRSEFIYWNGSPDTQGSQLEMTIHASPPRTVPVSARAGWNGPMVHGEIVFYGFQQSNDLWFFDGCIPGNYCVYVTVTALGMISGPFEWTVTSGADAVDLVAPGGDSDSVTTNSNFVIVKSTGASSQNGVGIRLERHGKSVDTHQLTVHVPIVAGIQLGYEGNSTTNGFSTVYTITLQDQLGVALPASLEVSEAFPVIEFDDEESNWGGPAASGRMTGVPPNDPYPISVHQFTDKFHGPEIEGYPTPYPLPVGPSHPDAGIEVKNAVQAYFAGSETPYVGCLLDEHSLQMYRGMARQGE
jgi:hypothetical protein